MLANEIHRYNHERTENSREVRAYDIDQMRTWVSESCDDGEQRDRMIIQWSEMDVNPVRRDCMSIIEQSMWIIMEQGVHQMHVIPWIVSAEPDRTVCKKYAFVREYSPDVQCNRKDYAQCYPVRSTGFELLDSGHFRFGWTLNIFRYFQSLFCTHSLFTLSRLFFLVLLFSSQ